MPELWGCLTCQEVLKAIPSGTLSPKLRKWANLSPAILQLPDDIKDRISQAAASKDNAVLKCKQQANTEQQVQLRAKCPKQEEPCVPKPSIIKHNDVNSVDMHLYMQLPSVQEMQSCIAAFLDATGNEAL
ncbi:hypothetical protein F5J12DRAFT_781992 [Pisolithus orientalis]|uniref:uncharacterized protein n=1 Tax=Pisolithus orientalis TaxID=936130 RepID=UPI002223FE45|nr:uncharacterized protein F5J12DRAFT_781992 [Pisolithus orientalis]KAI6009451.1 hypothetical protein F5J12DRAFT_781992 [Pisolithus orientalis]